MKTLLKRTSVVLLSMLVSAPGTAHHSVFAEFDINGSITIEGVITEVWFKSPHIRVFVDVTDDDGNVVNWNTHGHNASMLRRNGWTRTTLSVGERVTMSGDPTYDGSPRLFIRTIVREDGSILENKVGP